MTPAARVQATLELLEAIDGDSKPADRQSAAYFRSRRYIGSKDRRAIADRLYLVLRHRARLDWWLQRHSSAGADGDDEGQNPRSRLLAALALSDGAAATETLFDGSDYGPQPLSRSELALVSALDHQTINDEAQPDWVRGEMPEWLLPGLRDTLGDDLERELSALTEPASLTLRVNTLKATRDSVQGNLAQADIVSAPTDFSPFGLRVTGRHALPSLPAFNDGLIEVQDEGSQIVALLCDAQPGMAVADFCAGGGGKTLALGAAMQDRGTLVALDVDEQRLRRAGPRLARSGLTCVQSRPIAASEDAWLAAHEEGFDRVLVDAPCSGIGAWRRNPDARWRLTPTQLGRYRDLQQEALGQAARLVRPGGRLIYATCSLFAPENAGQVAGFLEHHPGFKPIPVSAIWRSVGLDGPCPSDGDDLVLTPARHGTDGFFVAVLERRA